MNKILQYFKQLVFSKLGGWNFISKHSGKIKVVRQMDKVKDLRSLNLLRDFLDKGIEVSQFEKDFISLGFSNNHEWYRKYLEEYELHDFDYIVDIGCGYGRWPLFLAECNKKVAGVDASPAFINIANNLKSYFGFDNLNFQVGLAESLPLETGTVDAVFVHGVSFQIPRNVLFNGIHKILKHDGILFVGAMNAKGKVIERLCTGYTEGGFECEKFMRAAQAVKNGPLHDGPCTYATTGLLEEIMNCYGFAIDRRYPVKDFSANVKSPIEVSILQNMTKFLDLFYNDPEFRNVAIKNCKIIMKAVEFDFWFRAIRT